MLNISAIMGRLTADPELRHTQNNVAVTAFTVAVDRSYVKQGEDRQADFIDVVAWRSTAEFVCKYFTKGKLIAISGTIQTRNWEDKNGNKRKATEIVASDVSFGGDKNPGQNSDQSSQAEISGQYIPNQASAHSSPDVAYEEYLDSDDDLPF